MEVTSWTVPGSGGDLPRRLPLSAESRPTPKRGALAGSPVDRLGPRRVGAILDAGFEVIRFRFAVIAAVTAAVVLPLTLVPVLIRLTGVIAGGTSFEPGVLVFGSDGPTWSGLVASLGPILSLAVSGVMVTHLVQAWLVGSDPRPRELLGLAMRRGGVAIAAWLLVAPIKAAGFVACGVGAILPIAAMLVLSPVVGAEGLGVVSSVRRTWQLSRRRLGALMGLTSASVCITLAFSGIVGLVQVAVLDPLVGDRAWGALIVEGAAVAFNLFMIPLQAAWAAIAYLDLRVRTEGLDLELETGRLFDGAR